MSRKMWTKKIKIILTAGLLLALLVLIFGTNLFSAKTVEAGWFASGGTWGYRKAITVDADKVSGSSALTDFPMLFSVTDGDLAFTDFDGNVASSTAGDIVFTSSDGVTKLSHEIEYYASTTGEIVAWVKIPSLSNSVDTTIYIYYGNAAADDQQDAANVWDSNYMMVQHLSEDPSGSAPQMLDSTANNNDGTSSGTMTTSDQVSGKIDGSLEFDGNSTQDDLITVPNSSVWDNITTAITISAWVNPNSVGALGYRSDIIQRSSGNNDWWFNLQNSGKLSFYADNITGGTYKQSTSVINENELSYVVVSYDDVNDIRFYINGTYINTVAASGSFITTDNLVYFGANHNGPSTVFRGIIDELKVSNIVRSTDWIATEYNNQSSPSTFYTYGSVSTEAGLAKMGVRVIGETSGLDWYSTGGVWTDRKQITIDHNKVATDVGTENYTGFPMLFSVIDADLKDTGNGGSVGQADGGDILFTASDGTTKLSHEIEKYTNTTGELVAWVNLGSNLSSTTDTTIYVYYGDNDVSDQWDTADGSNDVFDSNYKGVWHLPDGSTLSSLDSTSNNNDGTPSGGTVAIAGKIDGGASTGSYHNNYISLGTDSSISVASKTQYTFEGWIKFTNTNDSQLFFSQAISGDWWRFALGLYGTDCGSSQIAFMTRDSSTGDTGTRESICGTAPTAGLWYHYAAVYDSVSGAKTLYINGSSSATTGTSVGAFTSTASAGISIGENLDTGYTFGGVADEVRVSATARSADWIKTGYNNQSSPSTFYSYGATQAETRQDSSGNPVPAIKSRGGVKFR